MRYINIKRLTLEERVTRLEKLLLEDSFDDELDAMANDIIKNNPQADIDKELDDAALDIVSKDTKFRHDTIKDWLDSVVFDSMNKEYPSNFIINNLQILLDDIEAFNSFKSMRVIKLMKKQIREISDLSYFKAKKIVVNAVKKAIDYEKEKLKKQLEQFGEFISSCTRAIRKEIDTCKNGELWSIEVPEFNSTKPIATIIIRRRKPFPTSKQDCAYYMIYEIVKNGKTVYNYETEVSIQKNLSKNKLLKEITNDVCGHIISMENL